MNLIVWFAMTWAHLTASNCSTEIRIDGWSGATQGLVALLNLLREQAY